MSCVFSHDIDPQLFELYHRKTLHWHTPAGTIQLAIPADVFSGFQVDQGTRALLRDISESKPMWNLALDLGCGYGPIALYIAKRGAARHVDAVERDALAVAFTRHNARTNGLEGVEARGGLAYEGLQAGAYDAVISNLPAKAGEPLHRMMLLAAHSHLREGGEVWVVVVAPLEEQIDRILAADVVAVRAKCRHKEHIVYRYAFLAAPDLPADPYLRGLEPFRWGRQQYHLEALHGLAEFDERDWATDLAVRLFEEVSRRARPRSLAVCNPGQGHLAVLACLLAETVEQVTVVSRDLIALEATRRNLTRCGYRGELRVVHAADFALGEPGGHVRPEWALAVLEEKEGLEVNVEKLRALRVACPACRIVAGCRAAFGSRLQDALRAFGWRTTARKKRKGFCAFCIG